MYCISKLIMKFILTMLSFISCDTALLLLAEGFLKARMFLISTGKAINTNSELNSSYSYINDLYQSCEMPFWYGIIRGRLKACPHYEPGWTQLNSVSFKLSQTRIKLDCLCPHVHVATCSKKQLIQVQFMAVHCSLLTPCTCHSWKWHCCCPVTSHCAGDPSETTKRSSKIHGE